MSLNKRIFLDTNFNSFKIIIVCTIYKHIMLLYIHTVMTINILKIFLERKKNVLNLNKVFEKHFMWKINVVRIFFVLFNHKYTSIVYQMIITFSS